MKNIIVYFSYSGNTDRLIKDVNKQFGFDVAHVERVEPYSEDYDTCAYVEAKEEWQKNIHPVIKKLGVDFGAYDNILLFFPIWWYTIPMPIATFVEGLKDFGGSVYAFANSYTNDPKYMVNSINDLKKANSHLNFKEGLFNKGVREHIEFIKKIK